jgi:DeoR/GlpR family transcriptional regulator of sugar metabolism
MKSRAGRLVALIKLMEQGERFTAGAIARVFGVTERTLYRDIKFLKQMDVPVSHHLGQYRLDRDLWAVWGKRELERAIYEMTTAESQPSAGGITV